MAIWWWEAASRMAGAIACGADFVYVGTRFIPVPESLAHDDYKQMLVDCTVNDLLVSPGVTGTPAGWLPPSLIANGYDPENMTAPLKRQYDSAEPIDAKRWRDVRAAGQGIGAIRAVEPLANVVDRLADEYALARQRFAQRAAS